MNFIWRLSIRQQKGATMNAILAKALSDDGDSFIPSSVMDYLGGSDVATISASIKEIPVILLLRSKAPMF